MYDTVKRGGVGWGVGDVSCGDGGNRRREGVDTCGGHGDCVIYSGRLTVGGRDSSVFEDGGSGSVGGDSEGVTS